jgi:hypothetical protein
MIMSVAHRTIILSLIMALLWPWAVASTCHAATPAKAVQGCCADRCPSFIYWWLSLFHSHHCARIRCSQSYL